VTALIDLEPGTQVIHSFAADADQMWLITTSAGFGFKAPTHAMVSRQKAGKQFITLDAGEALMRPVQLDASQTHVALLSSRQRLAVIESEEIKKLAGGGKGTILIGLEAPDQLSQVRPVGAEGLPIRGTYRNQERTDMLMGADLAAYFCKRARKGKPLQSRLKQPELG
jgi:topoisomerase-4 subunit A